MGVYRYRWYNTPLGNQGLHGRVAADVAQPSRSVAILASFQDRMGRQYHEVSWRERRLCLMKREIKHNRSMNRRKGGTIV